MRAGTVLAIAGVAGVAWWIWSRRQPSQSAGDALASAVAGPLQAAAGLAQGAWGLLTGAASDDADAPDGAPPGFVPSPPRPSSEWL